MLKACCLEMAKRDSLLVSFVLSFPEEEQGGLVIFCSRLTWNRGGPQLGQRVF